MTSPTDTDNDFDVSDENHTPQSDGFFHVGDEWPFSEGFWVDKPKPSDPPDSVLPRYLRDRF